MRAHSRSTTASVLVFAAALLLSAPAYSRQVAPPQHLDANGATYATLDEEAARKLVKGCSVPREVSSPPGTPGGQIVLQFTVSKKGKLLTVHRIEGVFTHQLSEAFRDCHFAVYKVNGMPTAFQTNIIIKVR